NSSGKKGEGDIASYGNDERRGPGELKEVQLAPYRCTQFAILSAAQLLLFISLATELEGSKGKSKLSAIQARFLCRPVVSFAHF
ncbi:MAG: hypothetical protein K0R08_1432, partial [Solimicrobium sp.]|nr:hypothetical protein [Solimicrobium sp.]